MFSLRMSLAVMVIGWAQGLAFAAPLLPSTLEVKKRGEQEIRQVVEPVLNRFCREQCKVIHIDTEVDVAVADETAPGFEDSPGKATLAPASGKVKLLIDENLGSNTRQKILDLLKDHLEELDYPVTIDAKLTAYPQPATTSYQVAELRERVTREIKNSLQNLLTQFCPDHCALGEFNLQADGVNPDEVNYASSQDFFQDGASAIRVKNVRAVVMVDQNLPTEEAAGIVEMAKLKVSQFKNSEITSQTMKFPTKLQAGQNALGKNGVGANGLYGKDSLSSDSKLNETSTNDYRLNNKTDNLTENKESSTRSDANAKTEKLEHYEKIERVENGDAVQQVLDKFKMYGIIFSAIVLALLLTLVAIGFRKNVFESKTGDATKGNSDGHHRHVAASDGALTNDEKAALIGKRIECDRLHTELTNIFSEQPKVAKHVFSHVLTEEGVETTAQYLELFGESVVMDLLRDPGLQADLAELMDFYARNTFDINDDERLMLLKKLHHRTVSGKMQIHGSRSAALFDFLGEMDAPQIYEMVKNESNTVKAIVLTQCDQKKRQAIFAQHDDANRLKLMTELSRIDHLPKNYISNVATALRRKKAENPKLNTEALPGTDVLVSFMEKSSVETQRTIIQQLMNASGSDVLHHLKSKLVSLETVRFIRDALVTEIITQLKHDETVTFLQGCSREVREAILTKAPEDLSAELSDALKMAGPSNREAYTIIERKVLNRVKVLANQGQINLAEINERMFAEEFGYGNSLAPNEVDSQNDDLRRAG